MNEWPKVMEDFCVSCLLLILLWRFADKWAGPFLDASNKQAEAMTMLAESVKTSASDSREILIAVRVQSQQIGDLKTLIQERMR